MNIHRSDMHMRRDSRLHRSSSGMLGWRNFAKNQYFSKTRPRFSEILGNWKISSDDLIVFESHSQNSNRISFSWEIHDRSPSHSSKKQSLFLLISKTWSRIYTFALQEHHRILHEIMVRPITSIRKPSGIMGENGSVLLLIIWIMFSVMKEKDGEAHEILLE